MRMQRFNHTRADGPSAPCGSGARWQPTAAIRLSVWLHVLVILIGVAWPAYWPWLLAAVLGNHLLLGLCGMWPRSQVLGDNLVRLPRRGDAKRHVALTF